jgi:hypothetical protein
MQVLLNPYAICNVIKAASGGVAEWLTRRTSNLRIADRVDSNPVLGKPLFPWARNFTFTA